VAVKECGMVRYSDAERGGELGRKIPGRCKVVANMEPPGTEGAERTKNGSLLGGRNCEILQTGTWSGYGRRTH